MVISYACDTVIRRVSTEDGGKHISKTGRQVVVAHPYNEWHFKDEANQKDSSRRNKAAKTVSVTRSVPQSSNKLPVNNNTLLHVRSTVSVASYSRQPGQHSSKLTPILIEKATVTCSDHIVQYRSYGKLYVTSLEVIFCIGILKFLFFRCRVIFVSAFVFACSVDWLAFCY